VNGNGVYRLVGAVLLVSFVASAGTTFRDDRVSLNGTWKFQLRRDNQLLTSGPVSFGPVSASSQAMFLEPWPGETSQGRWRTAVPWPVSSTILGSEAAGIAPSQLWKPHPKQQGTTWWQADLGTTMPPLDSVRIHWVKPGQVTVQAEVSEDGSAWESWARASSARGELETWIKGPPKRVRFLKLTFAPAQFDGTRAIDIFRQGRDGSLGMWQPRIQRTWYEALRSFTPQDGFHRPGFQDSAWANIRVPGYWEAQKFSEPTWWQPDDTVGYYRRTFRLPERWQGRQVRLRFEGVNNSAQIWINGQEIGFHESGFTAFEYDVTPYLKFGAENLIALRVCKWTLTHEYDTDDVWFLGGIWRDTYLYALPAQRVEDFSLRTELDSQYKDAVLRARVVLRSDDPAGVHDCAVEGTLLDDKGSPVPVKGLSVRATLTGGSPLPLELAGYVENPRKWTAETPHLYGVVLRLKVDGRPVHEFRTTLGFRQVEVKGSSLLLNGVPLKVHGVVTTRANPNDAGEDWPAIFAREIRILKESNLNMIRSHTTPLEEDFLDLCDKHGIYVMPDVPYVWVNEWDFRYLTEGAVLRAREIYEQHKNRASVIIWHIGNENDLSSAFRGMGRAAVWLSENDPTRPVTICRNRADLTEFATSIHDLHYYPMREKQFLEPTEAPLLFGEFHALPEEIERLRDRGFVESWGRSLKLEWTEFEKRPWLLGGLICCWDDGSVNGDLGPRQWGVVDSKRQAKDVAYHIRKVFAPVRLSLAQPQLEGGVLKAGLSVENRYNFTDLEGFAFRWELHGAGKTLGSGELSYRVKPGSEAHFPLELKAPVGAEILRVSVHDREGYSVQNEEFPLTPSAASRRAEDMLKHTGVAKAVGKMKEYRVEWQPGAGLRVKTAKGAEILTVAELVLQKGKSRKDNEPVGEVVWEAAQQQEGAIVVPFSVSNAATGRLHFRFGANWVQASYQLNPSQELATREIGLKLLPASDWRNLVWDRASLWSSGPEGWADGPRERAPLENVVKTISRRNLYWLAVEGGAVGLFIAPDQGTTNFRSAGPGQGIVLSEFLNSGDFLGKFDRETTEKRLPAGKTQTGGVTIYLLKPSEWTRLAR